MKVKKIKNIRASELNNKKLWKKHYFEAYTLAFLLAAAAVFSFFLLNDKSLLTSTDGFAQQYKAFVYCGKWLREILRNIFITHSFVIPQFSLSIGLGSDVITTLGLYSIGDPLNVFAVFFSDKHPLFIYEALILLRLYLSGLFFSVYCLYMKNKNRYAVLAGSLVYTFCGFGLYLAVSTPAFANALMYFPLILLGTELIFNKKRPYIFIAAVACAALSNIFVFYKIAVLTLIYVIGRCIVLCGKAKKQAFKTFFKTALYAILGVIISAGIVLPVAARYYTDNNTAVHFSKLLFYPITYYKEFLSSFVSYNELNYYTVTGFSVVVLLAVFLLFKKRNSGKLLKIYFVLGIISLLVPIAGRAFNGFSFVNNTWVFGFAMLTAYILVYTWHTFFTLTKKEVFSLGISFAVYAGLCFIIDPQRNVSDIYIAVAIGAFAIFYLLYYAHDTKPKALTAKLQSVILAVTVLGIFLNAFDCYSVFSNNFVSEFKTDSKFSSAVSRTPDTEVVNAAEKDATLGLYRYAGNGIANNSALYYGTSNTQYNWSVSNKYVTDYRTELNLAESNSNQYKGFDDRTALNALSSVKYYAVTPDRRTIPYGYKKVNSTSSYDIYKNKNYLPFGYTYSSYITREEYDSLSAVQKQEAMLQGVVLEKNIKGYSALTPVLTSVNVPFTVTCDSEGVTKVGQSFVVTEENATVTLKFAGTEKNETSLCVHGLKFKSATLYNLYTGDKTVDPENLYTKKAWRKMSISEQNMIMRDNLYKEAPTEVDIALTASGDGVKLSNKEIAYLTAKNELYSGRKSFDINMGYSKKPVTEITLTFPEIGTYSYTWLKVTEQPMENYTAQIKALKKNTLKDVKFKNNTLSGKITLDESKILCLTIPYSAGWTATVDGKPQEILRANTMYMALALTPGEHTVKLTYKTPYLGTGILISTFGAVTFAALIVLSEKPGLLTVKRKKKSNKPAEGENNED